MRRYARLKERPMKKLMLATALFAVTVFGVHAQQPAAPAPPPRAVTITPVTDAML